jgi:hypothetical protein
MRGLMIKLNVNEFNVFLRILKDEVERHRLWLETKDFVSEDELKDIEQEFKMLSSMLDDMKFKKQRLLTLLR